MATAEEQQERKLQAREFAGRRLGSVRYIDIDYEREKWAPDHEGPRRVESTAEWQRPSWMQAKGDRVDFAVEFTTVDGRTFTASWDPPGDFEGLAFREAVALGDIYAHDADVAVWDVTHRSRWQRFAEVEVADVSLHYEQTSTAGFWCPRLTLEIGTEHATLMLGDINEAGEIRPSVDNIVVLFPPDAHPG